MSYYYDEAFKNFTNTLEVTLADQPDYTDDELIRHQRAQIKRLVALETEFRKTLIAHGSGPKVYKDFVEMICVEKGNILSARPYFRERQEIFTASISKALKKGHSAGLYKFRMNWTFIAWIMKSRNWRNKKILDLVAQIAAARNEILEQNLPLAISQARGFFAATPRSHLSFMDVVQIQCQGLLLAIDKFCPPNEKEMTDQESLDAFRSFRAVAIGIMRRDRVNDYSQTLMHFYPRDRQKIYWANKMLKRFVDEVDHEVIAAEINNHAENKYDKTTAEEIADLLATASTVSADYSTEPDGDTVLDLAIGDETLRPDLKVEADELHFELMKAVGSLTCVEQKLLAMKGIRNV